MDSCFLCTLDFNCTSVDNKVVSQIEYLLPEITIIKWGIPLRICSVCEGVLYAFDKFKHRCVESSRCVEANIRGTVHVADNNAIFHIKSEPTEDKSFIEQLEYFGSAYLNTALHVDKTSPDVKLEPVEGTLETQLHIHNPDNVRLHTERAVQNPTVLLERISALPQSQLNNSGVSTNFARDIDIRTDNVENISIKEEQLEETPRDVKFYNKILQNIWKEENARSHSVDDYKDYKDNETEYSENVTTGTREEVWQKSSVESKEKVVPEFDKNYSKIIQNDTKHITHRTEIHDNLKTKMYKKAEYWCNVCNKLFLSKINLSRHKKKKHWRMKCLPCILCNKIFIHEYDLNKHIVLHNGIKKIQCSVCKKRFSNKFNFKVHIKLHSRSKNFCYASQSDSSTSETYLKNQIRAHKSIREKKAFPCISIKEEQLEETPRDVKFYNKILQNIWKEENARSHSVDDYKDYKDNETEYSENVTTGTREEVWQKSSVESKEKVVPEFDKNYSKIIQNDTTHITHRTEIHDNLKTKMYKKAEYWCNVCNKLFSSKINLSRHKKKKHWRMKYLPCILCNKIFIHEYDLNKHIVLHNGIKKIQCSVCKKRFSNKPNFKVHVKLHSRSKNFCYASQSDSSTSETYLKNQIIQNDTKHITHRTEIHDNLKTKMYKKAEYWCNVCNKLFLSKINLSRHKKKKHWRMKYLPCILCKKIFIHQYDLNKHIVLHNGIKKIQCSVCKKRFSNKPNFKVHIKLHSRSKNFCYASQSDSSTSETYLKNQIRAHKSIREKKAFPCTTCNKLCKCKKDFQCDICSKLFTTKNRLVKHMKFHCEINDFLCDICSKLFTKKKYLVQHMKIHSGIKDFLCDICSKSFLNKYKLNRHIQTHSEIKNVQCDICSKLFSTKEYLIRHMKIHSGTGIKDFECDICSKSFIIKKYLSQHKKIHSRIKDI